MACGHLGGPAPAQAPGVAARKPCLRVCARLLELVLAARVSLQDDIYLSHDHRIPYKWTAPEALSRGHYSIKSDVWSFGVLLHEVFSRGEMPYPGMSNHEAFLRVEAGYRMPCPRECTPTAYKLLLSCWNRDPEQRPSFQALWEKLSSLTRYENPP